MSHLVLSSLGRAWFVSFNRIELEKEKRNGLNSMNEKKVQ